MLLRRGNGQRKSLLWLLSPQHSVTCWGLFNFNTMHHLTVNAKLKNEFPETAEYLSALNLQRAEMGLKKYGTDLSRKDFSDKDWARHALEEALDLANYLECYLSTPGKSQHIIIQFSFMQYDAMRIANNLAKTLQDA